MISLDCEGLWGMADRLDLATVAALSSDNLRRAYDQLFLLLDKHELPATFASVSLFGEGREVFEAAVDELNESPAHRAWLQPVIHRLNDSDGWFLPELPARVADSGVHEWATHGFCHIPFDHPLMDTESRNLELAAIGQYRLADTPPAHVMVYPRNRVVEPELLAQHGINAHRVEPKRGGSSALSKAARVASEFNRFSRSEPTPPAEQCHLIPGGQPLNWRSGIRAKVPKVATVKRWESITRHALTCGGVVHLYLHPHNLITGHQQVELLDLVLGVFARARSQGLESITLGDFAGRGLT